MTLDPAGLEAAKQAVYESLPVVLADLVSRAEAEAAIGMPHGAGVPDNWIADVAVRAYLAAGVPPTGENPYRRDGVDAKLAWAYDDGFAAGRAAFDAVVAERDEAVKERDAAIEVCAAKIRERDAALAAGQKLSEAVLMDWATSRTPVIHGKTQQALINWRSGVLRDHDEKGTR